MDGEKTLARLGGGVDCRVLVVSVVGNVSGSVVLVGRVVGNVSGSVVSVLVGRVVANVIGSVVRVLVGGLSVMLVVVWLVC